MEAESNHNHNYNCPTYVYDDDDDDEYDDTRMIIAGILETFGRQTLTLSRQ
jgi:hypothetical protein